MIISRRHKMIYLSDPRKGSLKRDKSCFEDKIVHPLKAVFNCSLQHIKGAYRSLQDKLKIA